MLGATLDYLFLRSLAHRRNLATEEQLDLRFSRASGEALAAAVPKLRKLIDRFERHLPIEPGLRYLDMGCGTGELTLAFAALGAGRITGVDSMPRNIERARAQARRAGAGPQVRFICADLLDWDAGEKYDVLLSFDAFEHIEAPASLLRRMADFAAPGAIAVLAFGPLFHSPFGDHMGDFFRLQIPWRGLLFSEAAMLRVRSECFRPTDPAKCYAQVAGGLNQMRYSHFLKHVREAGWAFDALSVNTFLNRQALLRFLSDRLMRLPVVQDFFAHNVYAVLRRAA